MEREQARKEIKQRWREILPTLTSPAKRRVNGEESYVCPLCGHGAHGDGLTFNKAGSGLKCFGCGFSGDVIDLYQRANGADHNEALSKLAGILGITIDRQGALDNADPARQEPANYTGYYAECLARIGDSAAAAYLAGRGISLETARAFSIGFDPKADPASAPGGVGEIRHPAPRIIIPTCAGHYVARAIDPAIPKGYAKLNPNRELGASGPGIFNSAALEKGGAVFITEGAFDALSIIEAGKQAIALNSANNAEALIKTLEARPPKNTCFILAKDNDTAGSRAAEILTAGLERLKLPFISADISGGEKDPNDAFVADRARFVDAVKRAADKAARQAWKPDNALDYLYTAFPDDVRKFDDSKKTGFPNLDKKLGGLYPGLYCLAAISSLGKTTFVLQIADNLAAAGNDVIFFSLEQSRFELIAKSLARTVNYQTGDREPPTLTSLDIRRGKLNGGKATAMKAALKEYSGAAERLSIVEGNLSFTVGRIRDYLERYVERNQARPVVVIDYLQIIQPDEAHKRQSAKEVVDANISELKRISRDLSLTVFVICSVNRGNYLTPIDFESLKESGGIEYTADCVMGLQLAAVSDLSDKDTVTAKRQKLKDAKAATPREVELVCLKNRNGAPSFECHFLYYPAKDLFTVDQAREARSEKGAALKWDAMI